MFARLRRWIPGLVTTCLLLGAAWADAAQVRAEAAKLNNLGVAMMNQQLMDKAVANFDAAYKLDPSLATADLEQGNRAAQPAEACRRRKRHCSRRLQRIQAIRVSGTTSGWCIAARARPRRRSPTF